LPAILLLGLLWLAGCGPAADLWLRVEEPYLVPAECDGLLVRVEQAGDGTKLYERSYPLTAAEPFPVTLSLFTRNGARIDPARLRVIVTARLKDVPVGASGVAEVTLQDDQVTPAVIRLSREVSATSGSGVGVHPRAARGEGEAD
jgi:hypothetical protein